MGERKRNVQSCASLSFPRFLLHALSRALHFACGPLTLQSKHCNWWRKNRQRSYRSYATVGHGRKEAGSDPVPLVSPSVASLRTDTQNEPQCPPCTYGATGWPASEVYPLTWPYAESCYLIIFGFICGFWIVYTLLYSRVVFIYISHLQDCDEWWTLWSPVSHLCM